MEAKIKNEDIDGRLLLFNEDNWLKPADDNLYNMNRDAEESQSDHVDHSVSAHSED